MTSRTNHNNLLHQHKQGIINSLKFFLLWTGGSVLAVFLGFILRIRAGLDGWLGLFFIMAIPYMLVIIIIQSTIMTCFLSYLKKRNPDRMPRLYRLSWYLFAVVANAVWAPSDFGDQDTIWHPAYGRFSGIVFLLSVFIAIVLWGIIAVMALNSRSAMKFFIIWMSISTVVCGVILFVTKTIPLIILPIYVLVMLQSVIATVCYSKSLRHSPKK
jgi:putative membrane protein